MSKGKHMELPWQLNDSPHHHNGNKTVIWGPKGPGYGYVAKTASDGIWLSDDQKVEAEATAEYIVRACNAYPTLVEALKKMQCAISILAGGIHYVNDPAHITALNDAMMSTENALRAAGEEL